MMLFAAEMLHDYLKVYYTDYELNLPRSFLMVILDNLHGLNSPRRPLKFYDCSFLLRWSYWRTSKIFAFFL